MKNKLWIWGVILLLMAGVATWLVIDHRHPAETANTAMLTIPQTQGECARFLGKAEADAGDGVSGLAYTDTDQEGIFHRADSRDGQDPIRWDIQMPVNGMERETALLTSDVIHINIANHTDGITRPEVQALFWKDGGYVLDVYSKWAISSDSQSQQISELKPNEAVTLDLDSDGYTPIIMTSGLENAPIHLTLVVHFGSVPDFACQTDLPGSVMQHGQHLELQFSDVGRRPDIEQMSKVAVKLAKWPAVAWGPPALRRYEGREWSQYSLFQPSNLTEYPIQK